ARAVPLRPAIRSLAWPDAAAELQWRQGAAWSDLAHGRSLSAPAVGGWHDLAHPPRQSQARVGRSEAAGAAPAQADAARNRRRGQPDSPSGMGDHDTRRHLSLANGHPGCMTAEPSRRTASRGCEDEEM